MEKGNIQKFITCQQPLLIHYTLPGPTCIVNVNLSWAQKSTGVANEFI